MSESFTIGDTVYALDDFDDQWYEAVVTKVHQEGTYTVKCVESRRTLRRIQNVEAEKPKTPEKKDTKRSHMPDFKKALMNGLKKGCLLYTSDAADE